MASGFTLFFVVVSLCFATVTSYASQDGAKLGIDPRWDGIVNPHPELSKVGDEFSFAIIGCAQVMHASAGFALADNAEMGLRRTITEINSMNPMPVFTVYDGDLVNVPDKESWDNFYNLVKPYKGTHVLVHGNHEAHPPYTVFRDNQERLNGIRSAYYSFDCGKWHFIITPSNIEFGNYDNLEVKRPMMEWLRKDLEANKDKPTVFFNHIHIMPCGLSQLEWYTYTADFKRELIDTLAKWGNVKYYINAHVHNGIKVSTKISWTYKGINFLTVPTGTASRPYGEEFPEFAAGAERGGYYVIADIDGEKITMRARLSGVADEYIYPSAFQEFTPDKDVRMLNRLVDLPASRVLVNGSFEDSLENWYTCRRYVCDGKTGFLNESRMKNKCDGEKSAYLYAEPMGKDWLRDEYNELFQIVEAPAGSPVFAGSYFIEEPARSGGGYYRLIAVSDNNGRGEMKFIMHFNWGDASGERESDYYPRAVGYHCRGDVCSWLYLQQMAAEKQALFFRVPSEPGKWHNIRADIADLYNTAMGDKNAYRKLGVTKFVVAAGVWSNKNVEVGSGAFFDAVGFSQSSTPAASLIDNETVTADDSVFSTTFGQWQEDEVREYLKKQTAKENGSK